MTEYAQTVAGRGPPVNGAPLGSSGCPPIAAWGARQARQYQAAKAEDVRPHRATSPEAGGNARPLTRSGWRSAATLGVMGEAIWGTRWAIDRVASRAVR